MDETKMMEFVAGPSVMSYSARGAMVVIATSSVSTGARPVPDCSPRRSWRTEPAPPSGTCVSG